MHNYLKGLSLLIKSRGTRLHRSKIPFMVDMVGMQNVFEKKKWIPKEVEGLATFARALKSGTCTVRQFASSHSDRCQYTEQFHRRIVSTSISSLRNSGTASLRRLYTEQKWTGHWLGDFSLERREYRWTSREEGLDSVAMEGMVAIFFQQQSLISSLEFDVVTNTARKVGSSANFSGPTQSEAWM